MSGYERWLLGRSLDPLSEDLAFDSPEEQDRDGAGMTNWKEYLADTDTADSTDFFAIHACVVPVQGAGVCRVALWSENISSNRICRWARHDSLVSAMIPIFVGEAMNGRNELVFEADVEKIGFWRLEVRLSNE